MSIAWFIAVGLITAAPALSSAQRTPSQLDEDGIVKALGRKGAVMGEGYKVSFPRSDLHVVVGKVVIKPALALTAWAAFERPGGEAIAYGDLVLLESEVNPVISKLEERGIEILALHNHLIHERPRIMYIHFMGRGNESDLAKGLAAAIALTGTPAPSAKPGAPEKKPEAAAEIERIIGVTGTMGGGVLHLIVPRNDIHVTMMGASLPGAMGMNTPLNFQIEGRNVAINGDFMLLANEVNPVVKALRAHGIEVASLHNHMLDEEPRLFFVHFWADGAAGELAKGLAAALKATGAK